MELLTFKQNQLIAKKHDKVNYWYLVQEGSVIQTFDFSKIKLGKNAIIGMLERDIYASDYVAAEDTVLAAFVCNDADDIKKILAGQEKIRNVFLRAAIEQRHQLLGLYSDLYNRATQFHAFVESMFNDYRMICYNHKVEQKHFSKIEHFNSLTMIHKADNWEIYNSVSLVKNFMQDYIQLMGRDDSLTIGVIMEAAAQMRRFAQGIGEMESYLTYNRDILFGENESDLFELYFELAIEMQRKKYGIGDVSEKLNEIAVFAEKMRIYNPRMLQRRLNEFQNYDYSGSKAGQEHHMHEEIDIVGMDCVGHILEYAGYSDDEIEDISTQITKYRDLPDMLSTDSTTYALRKKITGLFYDIYFKVFMRAVKCESTLTPVLQMFLNFGFMDVSYLGEEYSRELYDICAHLDICQSERIFTIYRWLKCVYKGEKEPSKNEFDMDYAAYLADLHKNGKLKQEELRTCYNNREMRVEFEIRNMFPAVNKTTYGKITTFCPILHANDIINSVDKMLVTAEKLETAMNEVRKVDYSAFYREIPFSDPEYGINNDRVMKEILPDIILMPNAGTKVMMWQEISTKKSDTPGRFMFPILTAVDLDDLMLEAIGRFRWEMCRRMQGMRWNDVREKSLTAEYCDYLQFYRKSHDLSADAKEKLKGALVRAKNNYREVFVRDYINWIKFESKGSFRLNKVSRDILIRYCPFVKQIRVGLKENPLYQQSIIRFDAENGKKLQRYQGVYNKYEKAGGMKTAELRDTILYYEM